MNFLSTLKRGLLAYALLCAFPAMSDAGCAPEDAKQTEQVAKKLAAAFPAVPYPVARKGKFSAKKDQSTGAVGITFSGKGKTLFDQTVMLQELAPNTMPSCDMEARPAKSKPGNGLYVTFACEPEKTPLGCAIVIQPGLNKSGKAGWTYRVMDEPASR